MESSIAKMIAKEKLLSKTRLPSGMTQKYRSRLLTKAMMNLPRRYQLQKVLQLLTLKKQMSSTQNLP